jgi:hypothetical protein
MIQYGWEKDLAAPPHMDARHDLAQCPESSHRYQTVQTEMPHTEFGFFASVLQIGLPGMGAKWSNEERGPAKRDFRWLQGVG